MEEIPVVKEPLTPALPSNGNQPIIPQEGGVQPAPGAKTDSELLLKSLQDEREKRRQAEERQKTMEEELLTLKSSLPSDEVFSDEGKAILKRLEAQEQRFAQLEEEKNLEKLYNQYPVLRESADKFLEYRQQEHSRAKLESVAKLFLSENGLLEPTRKGLEKPTGGIREPVPQGMTQEDIKKLRETDYRKYTDMIKKGLI